LICPTTEIDTTTGPANAIIQYQNAPEGGVQVQLLDGSTVVNSATANSGNGSLTLVVPHNDTPSAKTYLVSGGGATCTFVSKAGAAELTVSLVATLSCESNNGTIGGTLTISNSSGFNETLSSSKTSVTVPEGTYTLTWNGLGSSTAYSNIGVLVPQCSNGIAAKTETGNNKSGSISCKIDKDIQFGLVCVTAPAKMLEVRVTDNADCCGKGGAPACCGGVRGDFTLTSVVGPNGSLSLSAADKIVPSTELNVGSILSGGESGRISITAHHNCGTKCGGNVIEVMTVVNYPSNSTLVTAYLADEICQSFTQPCD